MCRFMFKFGYFLVANKFIIVSFSRELTDNSLPKIGLEFGGRDHTTVIHAHDKILKQLITDTELQKNIEIICQKLN